MAPHPIILSSHIAPGGQRSNWKLAAHISLMKVKCTSGALGLITRAQSLTDTCVALIGGQGLIRLSPVKFHFLSAVLTP